MGHPIDVLVVGGGPAGSATAALLARRGWRVMIVDRAAFPRPKPCGDYLNPGCDDVLARVGVRDAVARVGAAVRGMRIVTPGGDVATLPFPRGHGWATPRQTLDQVLLEHAARAGAAVCDESRVVSLDAEARAVRVGVERRGYRREYLPRLVVGADGLRSFVARAAGIGSIGRRGRYTVGTYLAGVDSGDSDAAHWGEIHLRPNGYCGVSHLPNGLANVTLAVPRAVVRAWRRDLEAGYRAWLRACPGLSARLSRAERAAAFAVVGPLGYHRRPVGRGRVLLVGDAAAHIDPMTGQGVYFALRGAELCAAAAADALERDRMPVLRGYAYARWREFGPVFAASRLIQYLAFRPAVLRRAASRLAMQSQLGARLIGVVGNTEGVGGVLNPAVLLRLLGPA